MVVGDVMDESTRAAVKVLRENEDNSVVVVDTGSSQGDADLDAEVTNIKDSSSRDFSAVPDGISVCIFLPSASGAPGLEALVEAVERSRAPETPLFSASDVGAWRAWGPLDDVVMGGVSDSGLRVEGGRVVFSGTVSTSNNGGMSAPFYRSPQAPRLR